MQGTVDLKRNEKRRQMVRKECVKLHYFNKQAKTKQTSCFGALPSTFS